MHCSSSPWGARITRRYFGSEGVTWVRPHEIPPVFHTLVSNPMEKESKAKRTEGTWLCVYWEHALRPAEPLWEFLRLSCVFLDGGQVAIQSGWMDGTPVERYHQSFCPSLPSQGFRFPPLGIPAREAEVSEETALLSWQTWPPVVTTHNMAHKHQGESLIERRRHDWQSAPFFFLHFYLFIFPSSPLSFLLRLEGFLPRSCQFVCTVAWIIQASDCSIQTHRGRLVVEGGFTTSFSSRVLPFFEEKYEEYVLNCFSISFKTKTKQELPTQLKCQTFRHATVLFFIAGIAFSLLPSWKIALLTLKA